MSAGVTSYPSFRYAADYAITSPKAQYLVLLLQVFSNQSVDALGAPDPPLPDYPSGKWITQQELCTNYHTVRAPHNHSTKFLSFPKFYNMTKS